MEFGILGPLRVCRGDAVVELGPYKQRALLALLAVHAGRVVPTERILEELWGDEAFGKEQALWVYVSRLRSALEPDRDTRGASDMLLTRDHGYVLAVDPATVDAVRAERWIEEARALLVTAPAEAVETFERALGLWRGDTLEEFAYHEFARHAIARYEELRAGAAEDRLDALIRIGQHDRALPELEELQQQHPLRERPVALLMLAAYRSGRHVEALRAFERFRKHLADELGVVPSPELRRLQEQVLLHDERLHAPAGAATLPRSVTANPFKGLRAFDEEDAPSFFGREQLVADVVRRIADGQRLITLVGPSGSGKSSVLGAGVVAALRKDALEGSSNWVIARMVPGVHPFAELEAGLVQAVLDPPATLGDALADEEYGILRAALTLVTRDRERVVLVVDQLEELFTTTDPARRERFLSSLVTVLDDPRHRVLVLTAVRADFYDRLLDHGPFAERMSSGIVNVVALRPDELEQAMQGPLEQATVGFDRALMATLIGDVLGRPASLPLYQYTLTELFDRRRNDTLSLDDYRAMGGVSGVIGATADELYGALDDGQRAAMRAVLLRLVTIDDGGQRVRRRVEASELLSLGLDVEDLERVLDDLGRRRLVAFDRSPTGAPTVELAHESLITEWEGLRGWIDEAHEDIRRRMKLDAHVAEWVEHDRDPEFLLSGGRLAEYEAWAAASSMPLDDTEREFVRAAVTLRDDRDHEAAEREERLTTMSRRARRRTVALVMVVVVALLAAGGVVLSRALRTEPTTVAMITHPANDQLGIIDQIARGVEQAARMDDVEVDTLRPLTDVQAETEALLESEPDLAIMSGLLAQVSGLDVAALAQAHPDTHFVLLDHADSGLPLPANVTLVTIPPHEGAFLAGAAAALTSTTGTIGYLGGHQMIVEPFRAGYEAGARAADPDVRVLSRYPVGPTPMAGFDDAGVMHDAASQLYRDGADVIFHAAGDAGRRGVPEAAAESQKPDGPKLWAIGVDVDEYLLVEERLRPHVLTSMVKRHDVLIPSIVRQFRESELASGAIPYGLTEGALELTRSGDHLRADDWERIDQLRAAVASGAVVVPELPIEGPSVVDPADATVALTVEDDACRADEVELVDGDILRVDIENRLDTSPWVVVGELHTDASDLDAVGDPLPYTAVDVAPGGRQVLTARMSAGRYALGCYIEENLRWAAELPVTGAFMAFSHPADWSAPMLHPEQGFMFHPHPDRTDAVYLIADPAPFSFDDDCTVEDGEPGSADDLAAYLRTLPGIEVSPGADVEIDGQPARVFDVTLSEDATLPCERLPLFHGSKDEQLFRTDLLPGESVRFLVFDAPESSPVRTGMIGVHAAPGGDLDELAAVTADFIADLRFGD